MRNPIRFAAIAAAFTLSLGAAQAMNTPPSPPPGTGGGGSGGSSGGQHTSGSPTPVPEPGVLGLFALGLGGVVAGRKLAKKKRDD